jgi:glycosyltransferase involved in cell wall biosynthesis
MSDIRKPQHIVHLSYTVPRPSCQDPDEWLRRVEFINGVPEALAKHSRQTVIYNIEYKGELTRNGVRYLFPGFKRWQLHLPFGFNRLIKKLEPDVVIVHGLIFPLQVVMLRAIIGPSLKIICQHHAEWPFKDLRILMSRWADRYVGAYLFASKRQAIGWTRNMSKVQEIIGASSYFLPGERKEQSTYLWVGDLNRNKNPLLVAGAFAGFAKRHGDVVLDMIYPTGELERELRQIASGSPAIRLVGKVDHGEMQTWFRKAQFIIASSFYEGSGIAVCEALSCGCIPILSNIPSFAAMTNNFGFGMSFDPADETSLESALETSYGIEREAESKKVTRFFLSELSFEANARKIMDVIGKI